MKCPWTGLLLVLASIGLAGAAQAQSVTVTINTAQSFVSKLSLGATHAQYDLDTPYYGINATAAANAIDHIYPAVKYQVLPIYGWGTSNPEPSSGDYAFENLSDPQSLRSRVKYWEAIDATPVITLCSAPDWMQPGGAVNGSTYDFLNDAPLSTHYADFAALAQKIADYFYPAIKYYQVWNEFKGFYNANGTYDYTDYTIFYNDVYNAIKADHPDIQVGGPYLVLGGTGSLIPNSNGTPNSTTGQPIIQQDMTVLNYWWDNKAGADFFTVDRAITDFHDPNDSSYTLDDKLSFTHTFGDIPAELSKDFPGLPIWYAEYYLSTVDGTPDVDVLHASALYHMLMGGTSVALMWQPMESGNGLQALFTDANTATGGQPTPFFNAYDVFSTDFPRGTTIYSATTSSTLLEALASPNHTLLINKSPSDVNVTINGGATPVEVNGYSYVVLTN